MILFERTNIVPKSTSFQQFRTVFTSALFAFESDSSVVSIGTEPIQEIYNHEEKHDSTKD